MSQVLLRAKINRVLFDPANPAHLKSFESFLRTGNWGEIQFIAEPPYTDVPMYVLMTFAKYKLKVQRETAVEQEARLDVKTNVVRFQPALAEVYRENFERSESARKSLRENCPGVTWLDR